MQKNKVIFKSSTLLIIQKNVVTGLKSRQYVGTEVLTFYTSHRT